MRRRNVQRTIFRSTLIWGIEIRLAAADRIEKRLLRIKCASGSRFKSIACKRRNASPRTSISMPGNCPISVTGTMITRFIANLLI